MIALGVGPEGQAEAAAEVAADFGQQGVDVRAGVVAGDLLMQVPAQEQRHDPIAKLVSRDRARSWEHLNNYPIGQFYNVDVDMQEPYHIYGGMQDNGSICGPSRTFNGRAGIRTSDAAPISIIEFVDRDVSAKGQDSGPVMADEEEFEAA